jgi:hypothetical protein
MKSKSGGNSKFYLGDDDNVNYNSNKQNFNNVQFVNNEHYDMAYDINDTSNLNDLSEDLTKSKNVQKEPSHHSEEGEEEEYEEEEETPIKYNQNIYSTQGIENKAPPVTKELPKFDISEFYNLNMDSESKELLNIMNR